jgi:hypothetical protein
MWAVVAVAINAIGGAIFAIAWPDLDERATVVTVSIILGALLLAAAGLLWNGIRWGAFATITLNAFNILLAVPGYFNGDSPGFVVAVTATVALSVITLVLVLTPESRQFWNKRSSGSLAA